MKAKKSTRDMRLFGINNRGYIYFVSTKSYQSGVKIGYSYSPIKRIGHLKSEVGIPLRLIGFIEGTKKQEKTLHRILWHHKVHGEWFDTAYKGKVNAFIGMLIREDVTLSDVCKKKNYWHEFLGGKKKFCQCGRLK